MREQMKHLRNPMSSHALLAVVKFRDGKLENPEAAGVGVDPFSHAKKSKMPYLCATLMALPATHGLTGH